MLNYIYKKRVSGSDWHTTDPFNDPACCLMAEANAWFLSYECDEGKVDYRRYASV